MALVHIPIRIASLQTATNPGNIYWKKVNFTNWETQWPSFKPNVESSIYGLAGIPTNINLGGATKRIDCGFHTTGRTSTTVKLQISSAIVGWNINAPIPLNATLTAETLQNFSLGVGYNNSFIVMTQNLTPNIYAPADDPPFFLIVKLFRDGDDAGDTL